MAHRLPITTAVVVAASGALAAPTAGAVRGRASGDARHLPDEREEEAGALALSRARRSVLAAEFRTAVEAESARSDRNL
jgi:hypothetical protein